MAGYSLDTRSNVTTGPVDFGSTFSGGDTVVFGTSNPGVTAAVSNLTGNPWLLAIGGAVVLGVAFLYLKFRRK